MSNSHYVQYAVLWENYLVMERLKKQEDLFLHANNHFWRRYSPKEIDFVEKREGRYLRISLFLIDHFDFVFQSIRHNDPTLAIDIQDIESKLFCNGQPLFRPEYE